MRVCVLSVVVMVLVCAVCLPHHTAEAQGWEALLPILVDKIGGLFRNDRIELLGYDCKLTVNPKIKRFQLYYKGRFWCPGWTNIRGEAETRSNSGVAGRTITDFVTKAHNSGLISEQDAQQWIDSH
ncbi:hypothetical protein Pcinc_042260 [Petrolisthes cinctipes]|uniref:Anti-lipopolysaccharide factor n=1 Tax=Petrolisthes cinctipes TaxID=88211 RepID=A0AAE1BIP2_PETCI|nr:hypothetical protein Pcinc_042260 [Petrolisthes cinctipes]